MRAAAPWAQAAYSTVSALRTMELILGVEPMSKYDALATPMSAAFVQTPNLRPYTALVPAVSLTARNSPDAPMAKESLAIDFSKPDRIPMQLMNEILWKNIRGAESVVPPTRHTAVAIHPRFDAERAAGSEPLGAD